MKNKKRIIALCTLLVLCFGFAGCAYSSFDLSTPLATQRAEHAVWGEKNAAGEYDSILYGEHYYFSLKSREELWLGETKRVFVTEADVPLLLRERDGDWMQRTTDNRFIFGYGEDYTYYCREDCYEEFAARLSSPFKPDLYGYEYIDENYKSSFEKISKEHQNLLFGIQENATPIKVKPDEVFDVEASPTDLKLYEGQGYGIVATIYGCSKDLLQRREAVNVLMKEDKFFLAFSDDFLYPVTKAQAKEIRLILSKSLENPNYPNFDY